MAAASERFMREFYTLWKDADITGITARLADDCVYDNVPVNQPMRGPQAVREWLEAGFAALDSIVVERRTIAVNGEWVLTERLDDHISGSKHMLLPVMNATRIVNGRIAEYRDYFDRVTVQAIGLAESA